MIFLPTVRIASVIVTGGRGKIHCFESTISLCLTRNYEQCIGADAACFLTYTVKYFVFLIWLGRRQSFQGQMIGAYFILYGIERGVIEFFRGDPGRTLMFHDSVSLMQMVSVGLIVIGSFLWWRGLRGANSPAAVA